jgi:hypothetical protein
MEDGGRGIVGRLKRVGAASAKAGVCFLGVGVNIARADRARYWMLRGTLHIGVVCRLLRPNRAAVEQSKVA